MINAKQTLVRLGFNIESPLSCVQRAREKCGGDKIEVEKAVGLIHTITGIKPVYTDAQLALHVAQQVVLAAVHNDMFDPAVAIAEGEAHDANMRRTMGWVFAKAECTYATVRTEQVQVIEGLDVTVAVKEDGTLKKGSKGVLAEELWKKHMLECEGDPLTNKEFVKILVSQAGFTKSGANTYAYNMKKKFGIKAVDAVAEAA